MFVKDLFFGVDFDIYDKRWGLVGMGSRTPWNISNRILDSSQYEIMRLCAKADEARILPTHIVSSLIATQ